MSAGRESFDSGRGRSSLAGLHEKSALHKKYNALSIELFFKKENIVGSYSITLR